MKFIHTKLPGAYIIELEKREDERGFSARTWCANEFRINGIDVNLAQGHIFFIKKKGTLRGIHWQAHPKEEANLLRVTKGVLYKFILDMRRDSPTYKKWEGFELKASDNTMLFTPEGVAHAALALEDSTEFINFSTAPFTPECERGIRYDDPTFRISWPIPVEHVSSRDASWPLFLG